MCEMHKIKYVVPVSTVHTVLAVKNQQGDFEVNALPTVTHQVCSVCTWHPMTVSHVRTYAATHR